MPGTTPSWFCHFPNAFVNNDKKKFEPKVAAAKFYNYKHDNGLIHIVSRNKAKHIFICTIIFGGGPSNDHHSKFQGVLGIQKNHILNALVGRMGSS